ncbi:oxidoreductase [Dyella sp. 20L07]|uniref:oxidoreductase n=1 Tax=Dyella sp. 20L07 TaxID=3384240 RepID=UPI003D27259C
MSIPLNQRIALVTGASSGIGEATALRLASMGMVTYAAARRVERMEHLKRHGIHIVPLDVTDAVSIDACISTIRHAHGEIDVLVNNAGYGSYGAIEDVPLEEGRRQVEVNLFGLVALTQQVIPHMRKQRWGKILNVTSIGGVQASPYGGWYHASKFAVEGLSSSLRQELEPFDVDVVLIRPGAIKSEWGGIAEESLLRTSGHGPYAKAVRSIHDLFTGPTLGELAGEPSVIADVVAQAVIAKRPKTAYIAPRKARVMVAIGRWSGSDRLRDRLTRIFMKLPAKM